MFPHEPSAPVGEASVFLIGGKSTFRSTDALVEQGMRLPTRGQGLQIKQQNQRIINSVMISKLPEKAPTVVSRCERMNPESYAVQVTRTELPLQSYGNFGKRKEEGPFLLSDGGTYIGTVEGEHPHGKGKWIGKEGQMYEGGWKDGLWNGEGRFISSTGDIYQGSWESGKKSGKGLMQLLCGYLYRGQWQDDLPHGLGHQREPNGDVYDGPFVLGIKEGEGGEFKCAATGEIHTGKFEQGCLMFGKVIRPKEMEEYEGWLKLGLYDGVGELRCSEGVYNGEFVSGRRHGKGSMVYDGGMTEYQGGWKWGRQDGQGKIIHKPTGRVEQEGYWKAGKFINADIKFGKSELSSLHSNIRQDTSSNSWY